MLNLFGPRYPTHPLPLELPDVGRRARGWGGHAPRLRECASEALRRVHALLHKEAVVGRLPFWVQTTALFHQGTLIHTVEDGASAEGPCAPAAHLRAVWMACWALRLCRVLFLGLACLGCGLLAFLLFRDFLGTCCTKLHRELCLLVGKLELGEEHRRELRRREDAGAVQRAQRAVAPAN